MVVYSLPTCGKCHVLKTKMERKGMTFSVIEDVEEMRKMKIMGVPVLQLDDGTLLREMDAIKWVDAQES